MIAELATQAAGGVSLGIYQDSVADEVRFLLDFSGARFVIAEDQEQVDKILEIRDRLPSVEKVIYFDPRGLRGYEEELLTFVPTVEALGRDRRGAQSGLFDDLLDATAGGDVAMLSTTSGTTGKPKLAMLTHDNLLSAARGFLAVDT